MVLSAYLLVLTFVWTGEPEFKYNQVATLQIDRRCPWVLMWKLTTKVCFWQTTAGADSDACWLCQTTSESWGNDLIKLLFYVHSTALMQEWKKYKLIVRMYKHSVGGHRDSVMQSVVAYWLFPGILVILLWTRSLLKHACSVRVSPNGLQCAAHTYTVCSMYVCAFLWCYYHKRC